MKLHGEASFVKKLRQVCLVGYKAKLQLSLLGEARFSCMRSYVLTFQERLPCLAGELYLAFQARLAGLAAEPVP